MTNMYRVTIRFKNNLQEDLSTHINLHHLDTFLDFVKHNASSDDYLPIVDIYNDRILVRSSEILTVTLREETALSVKSRLGSTEE